MIGEDFRSAILYSSSTLGLTWQSCLKQTGEWLKGEKLAPSNKCSS